MKKNLKQINPELEPGDRIILIHMDDYTNSVPIGSKGIVHEDPERYKVHVPKFSPKDPGYGYYVTWYDENEKPISKLTLLPGDDSWIYDKDYYKQ